MIDRSELQSAINRAKENGAGDVSEDLAYSIVAKVADKKTRMKFVEAIRYSLNELNVWDPETRRTYAKVVGAFFGPRGGYVSAKRAKERAEAGSPPTAMPPKPVATGAVRLNKKGQYEFLV